MVGSFAAASTMLTVNSGESSGILNRYPLMKKKNEVVINAVLLFPSRKAWSMV